MPDDLDVWPQRHAAVKPIDRSPHVVVWPPFPRSAALFLCFSFPPVSPQLHCVAPPLLITLKTPFVPSCEIVTMSKRKCARRFERLESRVLPAFSTQLLALLGTNDADPKSLVNVNGALFFAADDGVHGRELWRSNGTVAVPVKDILPGPAG